MEIDPNKPQHIDIVPKQTALDLIKRLTDEREVLRKRLNDEVLKNYELSKKLREAGENCQLN